MPPLLSTTRPSCLWCSFIAPRIASRLLTPYKLLQSLDLVFYGDSITESWRGLQVGVPIDKFKGIPEVFAKIYGGIKAAAYSVSGDFRRAAL